VETRLGVGTTVRITLPVTISTFRGLLVRAGGQSYLLPSEAVERHSISFNGRWRLAGATDDPVEGRPILLAQLTELLGLRRRGIVRVRQQATLCCHAGAGRTSGLAVEEILGEQEV